MPLDRSPVGMATRKLPIFRHIEPSRWVNDAERRLFVANAVMELTPRPLEFRSSPAICGRPGTEGCLP